MAENRIGSELRLCLPRSEIPTEDIIALAKELMRFQPTGFKSTPKARQFRRLGSKTFREQLRLNLAYDDTMHMRARTHL